MVHVLSNNINSKAIKVVNVTLNVKLSSIWPNNMMSMAVDDITSNVIAYASSCEEIKIWADMNDVAIVDDE